MSDIIPSRLETLSNELLLEVFDYVDACALYTAFYGLNQRFNNLFLSSPIHLKFERDEEDSAIKDEIATLISPSHIRSLIFSHLSGIDTRFVTPMNENMISLIINGVTINATKEIFSQLSQKNFIKNLLHVENSWNYWDTSITPKPEFVLSKYGHLLPSLVNCFIQYSGYTLEYPSTSIIFPHLCHLSLNIYTLETELVQFLQNNTPNLRSLRLGQCYAIRPEVFSTEIILKQVQELDFEYCIRETKLSDILSLFPNLKRLRICWSQYPYRTPFPTGSQFENILEKYCSSVEQFTVDITNMSVPENAMDTFYNNEYWMKRKMQVRTVVNNRRNRNSYVSMISFGRPWHFSHFENTPLDLSLYESPND